MPTYLMHSRPPRLLRPALLTLGVRCSIPLPVYDRLQRKQGRSSSCRPRRSNILMKSSCR